VFLKEKCVEFVELFLSLVVDNSWYLLRGWWKSGHAYYWESENAGFVVKGVE
jgi:hypothetical protein